MKSTILVAASIAALSALAGCATPKDPRGSAEVAALEEAVAALQTELSTPK